MLKSEIKALLKELNQNDEIKWDVTTNRKNLVVITNDYCESDFTIKTDEDNVISVDDFEQYCKACEERFIKWLFEDSEKPVLDETEKEYLASVIRPFRKTVIGLCKHFFAEDNKQYICISVRNDSGFSEYINLPNFNSDTMYKGMKAEKWYTLEELGL